MRIQALDRVRKPRHGDDYWTRGVRHGARMSDISRRRLITRGLAAAAGLSGLAVAARVADRYGLIPKPPTPQMLYPF